MKALKRNIHIFIIVTLASGWIGVLIDNILKEQPEGNSLGMLVWLVLPLSVSIILRITSHDRKDIGVKPNIFEEFAWRGYLTPKLIDLGIDNWMLYLISGLVWSLWHSAYYLVFLPDSYFTSTSRMNTLLFGCIIMVCWSVMYVETYRLAKSVWPCIFMHMIGNFLTVIVSADGYISFTKNGDTWLNPTSGIISIILYLSIGILLKKYRLLHSPERKPLP